MSNRAHPHDEGDADHAGAHVHDATRRRRLLIAFGLTTITLIAEAIGGVLSGSLALLADAGHMLIDALALLFAWLGAYFAQRPADARRSFGYARLEVLVGYTNALAQFALVAWIVFEAVGRFLVPSMILSGMMFWVAVGGLLVNVLVLRVLGHHDPDDINIRGARLHVLGDLLGSIGAVSAALVIRYLDWNWADPAISIFVSLLILRSAWRLIRESAHILLEGVPEGVEESLVCQAVEEADIAVSGVHHVHVWQLAGGSRLATLHAKIALDADGDAAIANVQLILRERFAITHATVQLERIDCATPGVHVH